tara:strand:+ start:557 stop:862 length:306 start_codon:yes stop_codon:yes gene_type:complete
MAITKDDVTPINKQRVVGFNVPDFASGEFTLRHVDYAEDSGETIWEGPVQATTVPLEDAPATKLSDLIALLGQDATVRDAIKHLCYARGQEVGALAAGSVS